MARTRLLRVNGGSTVHHLPVTDTEGVRIWKLVTNGSGGESGTIRRAKNNPVGAEIRT